MKVSIILWKHSKLKNGEHPVKIRIQDGSNKTIYKGTGVSVPAKFWRDGKVINHPAAKTTNEKLKELKDQIESNYQDRGTLVPGDSDSLYWWFERRIETSKEKHSFYHVRKQKSVLKKLKEFRPEIKIKHINMVLLQDLENWMLKEKHHPNYVADILLRLKVVVKEIVNAGLIKYHENPYIHFKVTKKRVEKVRLTLNEIDSLIKVKLKDPVCAMARDMYLLSFYCAGIRFGDLCRLKHSNIIEGRLVYSMRKTDKPRSIKLNQFALNIIKRQKTAGFIFDTKVDWNNADQSINSRNAYYNRKLQEACKAAEITEISFHTSRNTFADIAINKKVDAHKLKEMLGHSKITTTEIYMKDFYSEETDEAMDQIFGTTT